MASVAQTIRANQARELNRQVEATNLGAPEVEQVANGIPVNNDAALPALVPLIDQRWFEDRLEEEVGYVLRELEESE